MLKTSLGLKVPPTFSIETGFIRTQITWCSKVRMKNHQKQILQKRKRTKSWIALARLKTTQELANGKSDQLKWPKRREMATLSKMFSIPENVFHNFDDTQIWLIWVSNWFISILINKLNSNKYKCHIELQSYFNQPRLVLIFWIISIQTHTILQFSNGKITQIVTFRGSTNRAMNERNITVRKK